MKKKNSFLITAILLCSVWALGQNNPRSGQDPTAPAAQQPDKSQTSAQSDKAGQTIEGCLSGAANVFKLTDDTGKTYELTGDSSMLAENVGHRVRLWGNAGSSGGGARISASGSQATFGVTKAQSLADTCK